MAKQIVWGDAFNLLKKDAYIQYEAPLTNDSAMIADVYFYKEYPMNVALSGGQYGIGYRRYAQLSDYSRIGYSLGFRMGNLTIANGGNTEDQMSYTPYYDVGIYSTLNDEWSFCMRLEVFYLMAYTDSINIDPLLGLQIRPFVSFGYSL